MRKNIITIVFATIILTVITSCSGSKGSGKDGYTISDLYRSQNQELLNFRKDRLLSYCGKEPSRVGFDGKYLIHSSNSVGFGVQGLHDLPFYLSLTGLSYANVSKSIEEGDWFYMEYHEAEDRFYFYYVDLDKIKM